MKTKNQSNRLDAYIGRAMNGVIAFCLVLGFGFAELQAQEQAIDFTYEVTVLPDGTPMSMNNVTINAGDTIEVLVGLDGPGEQPAPGESPGENDFPYQAVQCGISWDGNFLSLDTAMDIAGQAPPFLFVFVPPSTFVPGWSVIPTNLPDGQTIEIVEPSGDSPGIVSMKKAGLPGADLAVGPHPWMKLTFIANEDLQGTSVTELMHMTSGNFESKVTAPQLGAVQGERPSFSVEIIGEVVDIPGCTNEEACNYNVEATVDDQSCVFAVEDCEFCNFDEGTVETSDVAGGQLAFVGTDDANMVTQCAGDQIIYDTQLSGESESAGSAYVITDASDQLIIQSIQANAGFSFADVTAGETRLIWHLSFDAELSNVDTLEAGDSANDLDGCFELSNSISVMVEECVTGPANDDCANATEIMVGDSIGGDNTGANPGNVAPDCWFGAGTADNDVWFFFTAPDPDQIVTIETFAGTNEDTQIAVYDACDSSTPLVMSNDLEACNDDIAFPNFMSSITIPCGSLIPGNSYYIQVDGYRASSEDPSEAEEGTFGIKVSTEECPPLPCEAPEVTLAALDMAGAPIDGCLEDGEMFNVVVTLSGGTDNDSYSVSANGGDAQVVNANSSSTPFGPFMAGLVEVDVIGDQDNTCPTSAEVEVAGCPPANDNCQGATELTCNDEPLEGTTNNATQSGLDPSCGTFDPGDGLDVFYSFMADGQSDYIVSADGESGFDGVLFVYSGACGNLVPVGECADNSFSDGVEEIELLEPEAGMYTVRLFDYSGTGDFSISLTCTSAILGCTDMEACNFNPEATEDDDSCVFADDVCEFCNDDGTVGETVVVGGALTYADGSESQTQCAGEDVNYDVSLSGNEGPASVYVVTSSVSDGLIILNTQESGPFNFAGAPADTCLVWHLSYDPENSNVGELIPMEDSAADLTGCFDLSNSIEIIREDCVDPIPGCTNMEACNFDPEANEDDGSCFFNNDACELSDGSLGEYDNCQCVPVEPSDCEDYEYYLADILEDGTTNIYEVELSGTEAALSLKGTSEYEVHIALNEANGLIYAVSKLDGSYRTFDPETGLFGPVEMLDTEVSEIVGATFNADGKLLILSQSENAIYSVMPSTNEVDVFDSYSPSLGGDIDFGSDGALYLATREGGGTFYLAIPDEIASDILKGDAPNLVTGIADTEDENFIFSHRDAMTLEVREYDGTVGAPYDITLAGEPFMTFNGDLASGCADNRQQLEDCAQVIYYTNEAPGADSYTLYSTVLNGDGTATNTALVSDLENAHIGVSSDGSTVYIVGNDLRVYDTQTETLSAPIAITNGEDGPAISSFPACLVAEEDGEDVLYIGGNGDNIYTLDPATGAATLVTSDYDVQGGDLVQSPDGEIWIITRNDAEFTRISDGLSFSVGVPEINGAAFLENGNVLVANGDGDSEDALIEINILTTGIEATYDVEFDVNNGDLAATCVSPEVLEPPCNYALYYVHAPQNGASELLAVTLNGDGTTTNSSLMMNPPNKHIGLTPDGSTLYMVGGSTVNTFDIGSATVTNTESIATAEGSGLSGFPAAVVGADGTLYAGQNGGQVYTIDPASGLATPFGPPVDVNGGDLIFAPTGEEGEDELWIITRDDNTFTRVSDGVSFTVDVTEINGAATLENGNVLLADGNGEGLFKEVDLSDASVVAEYETGLVLYNGDLAGGCTSGDDGDSGDDETALIADESSNQLSSFPNPTNGPSVAVFVTGQTERTTLEVYDMNGRLVEGLFSGVAEAGVEYRLDFDGLRLPNGVYMYRLTTESETIVEKFMIAK